jgi:hypothetical protein
MKTKEEIEQLKIEIYRDIQKGIVVDYGFFSAGFNIGYNQCQEELGQKVGHNVQAERMYTEEDMLKCWNTAFTDAMNIDSETYKPIFYSDFINSLNKQD